MGDYTRNKFRRHGFVIREGVEDGKLASAVVEFKDPKGWIQRALDGAQDVRKWVRSKVSPVGRGPTLMVTMAQLEWARKGLDNLAEFPIPGDSFVDAEGEVRSSLFLEDGGIELLWYSAANDHYLWTVAQIEEKKYQFPQIFEIRNLCADRQEWMLAEVLKQGERREHMEGLFGGALQMLFCAEVVEQTAQEDPNFTMGSLVCRAPVWGDPDGGLSVLTLAQEVVTVEKGVATLKNGASLDAWDGPQQPEDGLYVACFDNPSRKDRPLLVLASNVREWDGAETVAMTPELKSYLEKRAGHVQDEEHDGR